MKPRKRGRPGKAAAAAALLGSWDRSAERTAKKSKSTRGRPSARTLAARLMAEKRTESLTPEERSAIASAAGKLAPNPNPPQLRPCPHCQREYSARAMRKHLPECPVR